MKVCLSNQVLNGDRGFPSASLIFRPDNDRIIELSFWQELKNFFYGHLVFIDNIQAGTSFTTPYSVLNSP